MMCWNGTEFLKLQDNDECSKQVTDNDETGDDETEDMENQGVEEAKKKREKHATFCMEVAD